MKDWDSSQGKSHRTRIKEGRDTEGREAENRKGSQKVRTRTPTEPKPGIHRATIGELELELELEPESERER